MESIAKFKSLASLDGTYFLLLVMHLQFDHAYLHLYFCPTVCQNHQKSINIFESPAGIRCSLLVRQCQTMLYKYISSHSFSKTPFGFCPVASKASFSMCAMVSLLHLILILFLPSNVNNHLFCLVSIDGVGAVSVIVVPYGAIAKFKSLASLGWYIFSSSCDTSSV